MNSNTKVHGVLKLFGIISRFGNLLTYMSRVYIVMHQKQKENLRKFYKGKMCSFIMSVPGK